jgi:hypothetical protein
MVTPRTSISYSQQGTMRILLTLPVCLVLALTASHHTSIPTQGFRSKTTTETHASRWMPSKVDVQEDQVTTL